MAFDRPYTPFADLTDEQLVAALNKIEAAELSFVESNGQRTVSIGSVQFSYGSRADLTRIKATLIAAYNARVSGRPSPYKVTILMR